MLSDPSLFGTKRSIDHFEVLSKGGKVKLACDVSEKWQCIVDLTVKCGNKRRYRHKRTRGVSLSQLQSLESTIGGSLGFKGIAELSSNIRSRESREYKFEIAVEEEDEFEFAAPDCGTARMLVYQLTRVFELNFTDERFLHGDAWQREIVEWLPRTRDESKQTKNDPDCGCNVAADAGIDGLVRVRLNGMRLLESYNLVDEGNVHFNRLNLTVPVDFNVWPYEFEMVVPGDHVPAHMLFFSFEEPRDFEARFKPVDLQLPSSDMHKVPDVIQV